MSSSIILVVYRDEMYLRRVRDALSPAGYEVAGAASVAAAADQLRQFPPRVVVVCPCVGEEERRALAAIVQQLRPGLGILQLTPNHVDKISDLLQ